MFDCICPDHEDGYQYSQWIGSLFRACAYTPTEKIAYYFGAVSLVLWFFALLPQIITNFRRKSGKGVSLGFIGLSTMGGLCLLFGGLLTSSPLPISLLGLYVVLCNVIVASQVLYYGRRRRFTKTNLARYSIVVLSVVGPVTFLSSNAATLQSSAPSRLLLEAVAVNQCNASPELSETVKVIGSILSWLAGVIFFCSRAPQIYQNYQNKEVKLSLGMMILMVLGNVTLGLQIILLCERSTFWTKTFPGILASVALVFWDVIILMQAFMYRKRPRYF